MTAAAQYFTATLEKYTCCRADCGVVFGLEAGFVRYRRDDHKTFYCPNGHAQSFIGKSEAERLKEELEREKRKHEFTRNDLYSTRENRDHFERSARTYKGKLTHVKKRVGNGVCPCCNRTFQNLMGHMKTQHPKYKDQPK